MSTTSVLIAGCGDVGTRLGLLLAADGHEVWGLRRRPQGLPAAIRPLAADLADPATLAGLPACEVVVYAAAADRHDEAAYRRAYVDGVANLLAALAGRPPRRFVFVSSTGVYAQDDGAWVDEGSPTAPTSFTGTTLLEGERRVLAAPFAATAVRLAGIYGPGRTRLVDQVREGRARLAPEPAYTNRIHADDGAGFLAHLVRRELRGEPVAEVYVGVDDEPATLNDVLLWLAERLGLPRPPLGEPSARRGGSKRCRNDRLRATGYVLRYPSFREGYAAMLAAMLAAASTDDPAISG